MKRTEEIVENKSVEFEFSEAEVIELLSQRANVDAMGETVQTITLSQDGDRFVLEVKFAERTRRTP